jgi:hypothetical protein
MGKLSLDGVIAILQEKVPAPARAVEKDVGKNKPHRGEGLFGLAPGGEKGAAAAHIIEARATPGRLFPQALPHMV